MLGPFRHYPGKAMLQFLQCRLAQNSQKCRIIMDLSWPRNGKAVNDGIDKEMYMG